MIAKQSKVALVLGAGSARGYAHIGVLQVLSENNIPIDFIVGSSMGALVGGLYVSGTDLRMLDKMLEHINTNIFFDVHVPRMGFIAGKRISSVLKLMTKKKDFTQLEVPLSVVATDILTGQKVVIEEGLLWEAIRASISIPGVFNPVERDGMLLVDGAVIDRLPIEVARQKGADIIIAVDVTFGEGKKVIINNTLDVIMTSLDIMQKQQFDYVKPGADILLQPTVGGFSSRDFDRSREIIELGREEALNKLDMIKEICHIKTAD